MNGTPFTTAAGSPLDLCGWFRGAACFVILSGPSILDLDLGLLRRRGIATIGVNNSPAIYRPNIWTCVDRLNKFHDSVWLDPAIIKSVPTKHLHKTLRQKLPGGGFVQMVRDDPANPGRRIPLLVREMPGVIGHTRNSFFDPATWLSQPEINWGNDRRSSRRNGQPHVLNVMFCVLKHAYALGFRRVFLLGCDFSMSEAKPYAFDQAKHAGGVAKNNSSTYPQLNAMLGELRPRFDEAGFMVANCNPASGLTAFEFVEYRAAVEAATAGVSQDPLSTEGWYDT